MFDLIIHNGRVVDYKNHLDQVTDIAVKTVESLLSVLHWEKLRAISMQKSPCYPGNCRQPYACILLVRRPRQPENAGFSRCYNCHRNGRPCGQR